MGVSRLTTAGLAGRLVDVYAGVELRLLSMIAERLGAGVEAPTWATTKLAELQVFRRRAEALMHAAEAAGRTASGEVLTQAYLLGAAEAQRELDALGRDAGAPLEHAERAVSALVTEQHGLLRTVTLQVLRATQDVYRDVIAEASAGSLTGATTRLQDAQRALDRFADKGITGFVDSRGRSWELAAYVEMATRTATARAAVLGHLDRLEAAGINLVLVSDSPQECPLCRPWEGKVLSRSGLTTIAVDVLTGERSAIPVHATVAEAIAAGLFHPNCTHSLSGWLPGISRPFGGSTANPQGYEDRQKLRYMERQVRAWKRRQEVALDQAAKAKARARVRAYQAAIREFTEASGLLRQRQREQLGAR